MASTGNHGSSRHTGGGRRPTSAVYRRRRLLAAILILVALVALAAGALGLAGVFRPSEDPEAQRTTASSEPAEPGASPTTTPPATAAPTESPSPSASASPSAAAETSAPSAEGCAVVVEAQTDQPAYPAGVDPVLALVVRNEGDEPCEVNVGTSQMEFVLTADDERVFSSVDCQADSQDLERTIEPGAEERATFTWSRNRTVPDCTAVEEDPAPGEYTLVTRLGARSSAPVEFTLQ